MSLGSWSVVIERIDVSMSPFLYEFLEARYRRFEVTDYGLVPLTDEEWAAGCWDDVTPFNAPARERHYVRMEEK